ncbi:MAG: sigma-54-dependent Fis family transcriptional regulator [Gemmatimonadetes bacterium]|nr:sigma-54-dependent Fis family transcriptional regulator [Gemmatimonadota bacterium]
MAAVRQLAARAAEVDAPVLITGETGTGKGLLARAIHRASRRGTRPLVSVNCAGVPESLFESEFFGHRRGAFTGALDTHRGLFEQAHTGGLFLDELGELALPLQAKLLVVLEDREVRRVGDERVHRVDVRIIAATGRDLELATSERSFRRDLYHRIAVLRCTLPPLRERTEDIPLLIDHFLCQLEGTRGVVAPKLTAAARELLREYHWPGNVRELAHALESASLLADERVIDREYLEAVLTSRRLAATSPERPRYSFFGSRAEERSRILSTLERWRGNKSRAAAELGMARNTLRAKIAEYGLDAKRHPVE